MRKLVFALLVLPVSLIAGDFERNSGQIRYTGGEPAQDVFYRLRTTSIDWYFTRFGFSAVKKTYVAGGEQVSLKRVDFVIDKKGALTCAETAGFTKQISLTARDGSVLSFSVFEDVMTMQSSKGADASLSFELRGAMPEVNNTDSGYFEINAGEGISWYQMNVSGSANRNAEIPEPLVKQNRISYQHVNLTSLAWVTYCGGFDADELYGEALCPNGDLLVAGRSQSLNFPVDTNAVQVNNAGSYDAVICRIKPDGTKRWSTYLGGSGFDNAWSAAAIGDDFVVCGSTNSINFPVLNAAQPAIGGSFDAFVTRFDSNGTVVWSTYFGGSAAEQGLAVAVDAMDNIFIGGSGNSANMPMLSGGWQTTPGGQLDAFIARLTSTGVPVWATFCGGTATEDVHDLTTGPGGLIAACGETFSNNFPTTPNAFQTSVTGINDAYLLVMDTAGNRVYNTCIGGFNGEDANGVRFDAAGNLYITGYTQSPDFPVTGAQYQNTHNGGSDVFVARFNNNWQLNWATFMGSPNAEQAYCMALSGKYIYVGGYTDSPVFPVSTLADQDSLAGSSDAFYCKFDTAGNWITASYFGGTGVDAVYGIVVNADTMAYLVGNTFSNNLPTLPGVWQPAYVSLGDGFIAFRNLSEELSSNSNSADVQNGMQSGLTIGPNPAGNELLLQAETAIVFASLTDLSGKTVLKSSPNSNQFTFDLSRLSPGVYVLEVVQLNGSLQRMKIVHK
ncbi:MAG: T9SS type A sorting domain-containing protein [Bacteroidetes bacterium]|nr:T9SS type A sorting domain-containing protein [Bacteroidota bacterium]